MIGHTINQYQITAKLGEGGMGEVYLADDTNLKRQVALKFLPRHFTADAEARSRFKREAQALAALNHPNIVAVYDVTEHNGQPFIAMEYIEGQSLKDLVVAGNVTIDRAIDIAAQVAEGLASAHKQDITHRDIKSENIVLASDGRVRIMDFGLATWKGVTQITQEGSTVGTRAYMSPQQSLGEAVDHRTDLWSVGVVLYELITGRLPFSGAHDSAIAYAISSEEPEPIARYKSGSPDELQRIVSKCLAKNTEQRYQSAADLAADLKSLRATSGVSSVGVPAQSSKNTLIAVGAVVVVAAIASIAGFLWRSSRTSVTETASERKVLVVLPFENLGAEDQEYFADGMTEEITSRLSSVSGLGVISRTSAMHYKNSDMPLRDIGAELGVDFVLEGTIRWDRAGDTDYVLITPQLIQVSDDTHLWSDRLERPLQRVFAVQADIAQYVVSALGVALLGSERPTLTREPTGNLEAYDFYLRGRDIENQGDLVDPETLGRAAAMYRKAVAIDSQYALGYATLARTLLYIHWNLRRDPFVETDSLVSEAKSLAERALQLDPSLPEARIALGYYHYWGFRDYESALHEFAAVSNHRQNDAELISALGFIERRKGQWKGAYTKLKRALELDPASHLHRMELVGTCIRMHRFEEAIDVLSRGLNLYPESISFRFYLLQAEGRMASTLESRRTLLKSAATEFASKWGDFSLWGWVAWESRDFDSALAMGPSSRYPLMTLSDSLEYYSDMALLSARAGKNALEQSYVDSTRICVERLGDPALIASAGLASVYVALGQKQEAIAAAKQYCELLPVSVDAYDGPERLEVLADTYVETGEFDMALDVLEQLLGMPCDLGVNDLRFNPTYDLLRDDPRFQALIDSGDIVF